MKKLTPELVDTYSEAIITQCLPSGVKIREHLVKKDEDPHFWTQTFSTNSQLPFCPYFGDFRQCFNCDFNIEDNTHCENCHNELNLIEVFTEIQNNMRIKNSVKLI